MLFQRWQCNWDRTWPYALFKKHHTELNNLYWSSAAAAGHTINAVSGSPPTSPIASVLTVPTANARRVNYSVNTWQAQFKEFENWTRLNALMALKGYLETYLHAVASLALTSDPGLLISSPRTVDGIALVKIDALPDLTPYIKSLTKGTWQSRMQSYMQVFGHVPTELRNNVTELQAMQNLRNGVGHSFGRMISDYRSPLLFKPLPAQRLSEARLQKWLGIVDDVVNGIEEHLRSAHIGSIEVLMHYHLWDKKFSAGHLSEEKAFRAKFPDAQGNPPKAEYFREAINYYRNA